MLRSQGFTQPSEKNVNSKWVTWGIVFVDSDSVGVGVGLQIYLLKSSLGLLSLLPWDYISSSKLWMQSWVHMDCQIHAMEAQKTRSYYYFPSHHPPGKTTKNLRHTVHFAAKCKWMSLDFSCDCPSPLVLTSVAAYMEHSSTSASAAQSKFTERSA